MDNYIYQVDSIICIKKENFFDALQAVKANMKERWVRKYDSFEKLLKDLNYEVENDSDGNIIGVEFTGEKMTCDAAFWSAVAPYVEDGDYIEFEDEEYERWRWSFRHGRMKEITPKIVWEDCDE